MMGRRRDDKHDNTINTIIQLVLIAHSKVKGWGMEIVCGFVITKVSN